MAIFHLTSKVISRGKGQSAIASAAYRSGEELYSKRYDKSNFYEREVKPNSFILKPDHAPEWTLDREKLWNGVEEKEKSNRAQLAREIEIALPIELSHREQNNLAREYIQENFVDEGMVADASIHRDDTGNPHCHIMLTMRPFEENGEWGNKQMKEYIYDADGNKKRTEKGNIKSRTIKLTDWDSKDKLNNWRKNWANLTNRHLKNNGFSERISEKSYAEQGLNKEPTIHEGYVARQMKRKGKLADRVLINNKIKKGNYKKQTARKKYSAEESSKSILQSLSPKEKGQLKHVAKNLKVYVNYDNLIDKQRMINNWEKSVKTNQLINPEENYDASLEDIEMTKENLETGKEILEKQFTRIYEKYYPELHKNQNYTTYYKMKIAERTLEKGQVLKLDEIKETLMEAQDNEMNYMLKTIYKNPYIKPVKNLQRDLFQAKKAMENFYEENGVTRDEIKNLSKEKQRTFTKLYKRQDKQLQTLQVMDKYYNNTLKSAYSSLDVEEFSIQKKEQLSKAIDYYGNDLSLNAIDRIANEEQVNKFNTYEQKIGLSYLHKLENDQFTEEELSEIQENYQLKEIYDVVSDESMREYFVNEVRNNGDVFPDNDLMDSEGYNHQKEFNLGFLLQNVNLYEDLVRAQMNNLRNENEDKNQKRKQKKSKDKKKKKNRGMS